MTSQAKDLAPNLGPQDAVRRRDQALEISGWGERFTFLQPHNLCFWVYVVLTGVGVFQTWSYFQPKIGFYADGVAVGVLLCGLCGALWALWFHHIDRWERQPIALALAAIVWGGISATFGFALTVNTAMLSLYAKLFGQDWATNWAAGFTAPFTEESAKLCGFVLLMGMAPRLVRTANDGLVLGAFIGIGFAAFENFLYATNATANAFGTDPVGNAVRMSFVRIGASFVSHPLFSALVCSGAVYLLGTAAQPRRIGRGVAFILVGMLLHFTWDDAGGLGFGSALGTFGALFLSIVVAMVVLTVAFRMAAPREHQFVRDILAPEVEAGTLSEVEVETVVDKRARKAYRRSAPGLRARRARRHLRHAILDLTHDVAQARGSDTDEVRHARAEVARIRAAAEPDGLPAAG